MPLSRSRDSDVSSSSVITNGSKIFAPRRMRVERASKSEVHPAMMKGVGGRILPVLVLPTKHRIEDKRRSTVVAIKPHEIIRFVSMSISINFSLKRLLFLARSDINFE